MKFLAEAMIRGLERANVLTGGFPSHWLGALLLFTVQYSNGYSKECATTFHQLYNLEKVFEISLQTKYFRIFDREMVAKEH